MSRSTYYYQLKRVSRPDKYSDIKELIKTIFEHHKGCYGYRRVQVEPEAVWLHYQPQNNSKIDARTFFVWQV